MTWDCVGRHGEELAKYKLGCFLAVESLSTVNDAKSKWRGRMHRRINRTFGGYCLKFSLLEHLRDASSSGTDAGINSSGALELDSVWHAWIKYSCIVQIHSLELKERKRTYFVRWSAYCFCSTVLPACCRLQPVSTFIALSLCYMCSYVPSSSNGVCFGIWRVQFWIKISKQNR